MYLKRIIDEYLTRWNCAEFWGSEQIRLKRRKGIPGV